MFKRIGGYPGATFIGDYTYVVATLTLGSDVSRQTWDRHSIPSRRMFHLIEELKIEYKGLVHF
jgi:hypothetical protein